MSPVVSTRREPVAALHEFENRDVHTGTAWHMDPIDSALVIGSTQQVDSAVLHRCHEADVDVVRRRSGGSAVLVSPGDLFWLDVFVPRAHPLWDDDVVRSSFWLGDMWRRVLLGIDLDNFDAEDVAVHRGGVEHSRWSSQVCFAGLGPGEVTVAGRKIVGTSQRRNRFGARLQSMLVVRDRSEVLIDLLGLGEPARREVRANVTGLTTIAGAAVHDLGFVDAVMARVHAAVTAEIGACLALPGTDR
jgi:lipoate---protein ligase